MILARMRLENYKQFRDPVELFPSEGAIGVVGPNGSGKTTVFEAILWAFFGSRGGGPRFANDAIPWSGGSTQDRTLVEITVDMAGTEYTVSRSLQRNKTTARVLADGGAEVTSGPSEVASWVQEHILGMDRVAFEATFFARQKELEFFAGTTGVERQREVARMLRINQVEDAQKLLRSDRNDLANEVKWIENQLAEADHDELAASLKEKRETREALEAKTKELREEFGKRSEEYEKARAASERMDEVYREHNRLSGELTKAVTARERESERISELSERLRGLDEDEEKVSALEPKTRDAQKVSAEIKSLEEARRREDRRTEAKKELRRQRENAYKASRDASEVVERLDGDGRGLLSGWPEGFEGEGDVDLAREVCRVLEGADAAHLRAEEELRNMEESVKKHDELSEKEARLKKGEVEIRRSISEVERLDEEISEEIRSVPGEGPLEGRISALRDRYASLKSEAAQKSGLADAEEREAKKMEKARRMVEDSDEHARCPTCRRGFEKNEHVEVIESLARLEEESGARAEALREECRRLEREAAERLEEVSAAEAARSKVYELREKRSGEDSRKERMEERFAEIESEANALRDRLSGSSKPSPEDLEKARDRVERLKNLRDARPSLSHLVSKYDDAARASGEKEEEIKALSGGEPYDAARHEELAERLAKINNVIGEIKHLRSNLEKRPSVEEDLKRVNERRKEASAEAKRLEAEVEALGFDEERHARAREAVARAERLREEARESRDEAERELRDVESAVESLEREVRRHEEKRKLADEKGREAASLGDMDRLFSEFYRELTARVRPGLQREASDLMKTLTDGRYEKMEFDENYGVRLYDGFSEAYEVSRFSGGEADIASLCARVALSKMISGKGAGALGFIVLDEVFGALDARRRRNVLLALDRLKRTFGQLFIISHVSDVQESALLDETWFVEEVEEGRSTVRTVKQEIQAPVEVSGA